MRHDHPEHELAWVLRGSVVIDTDAASWEVTPANALWIPAGTSHSVLRPRDAFILLALVPTSAGPDPLGRVALVPRSAELAAGAELILQPHLHPIAVREAAYRAVLDALPRHALRDSPLPLPSHPGARAVAESILREPRVERTLAQWASSVHVSAKTLQRRFRDETGLSFTTWRRRARLSRSRVLLTQGHSVRSSAHSVGYATASAFIQAYRREYGVTPARARHGAGDAGS